MDQCRCKKQEMGKGERKKRKTGKRRTSVRARIKRKTKRRVCWKKKRGKHWGFLFFIFDILFCSSLNIWMVLL